LRKLIDGPAEINPEAKIAQDALDNLNKTQTK